MALNLEDKKTIVAEVSKVANESISLVVADYKGLSVPDMTNLRSKARESGVYLRIVRNTLARRALKGTCFECMDAALVGSLIMGFTQNEPSAAARLFKDFSKENDKLEVKALSIAGEFFEANQLNAIASLPTRDESYAQLAGTLMASINQLARMLAEPATRLARALDAAGKKKE